MQMLGTPAHLPEVRRLDANACGVIFREPCNQRPFGVACAAYG
jgi:hypothetical protein